MNSQRKGVLMIISGFSGAGKGTVVKKLLETYPEQFRLSISATTRKPRNGETEGIHYFYKTQETFDDMVENHMFLEYAHYTKSSYGTPRQFVDDNLNAGYDVLLEIEQQGAFQVKKEKPEAVLVFLTPPTIDELEARLRNRNTETEEDIQERLAKAAIEAENINLYDYVVINDTVEDCVTSLYHLICDEHMRSIYNTDKIEELQRGLQIYKKGE